MKYQEFEKLYWDRFIYLEEELIKLSKYIEITEDNFNVYSLKLESLILQIGLEFENAVRYIIDKKDENYLKINDYYNGIIKLFPNIKNIKVNVDRTNIVLEPFKDWNIEKPGQTLMFWLAYDNLKHHRYDRFKDASLYNCLLGYAGLYTVEMLYVGKLYEEDTDVPENMYNEKESKFFLIDGFDMKFRTSKIRPKYGVIDSEDNDRLY